MKICDVVQFYSPLSGGVRRYLEDKMRFFAQTPDMNHVVIAPSDRNAVERRMNTTFYEIKSIRLIGSISYRMLLNKARILSIIAQEKPDLIEVGDPYRSAWIALSAADKYKIPVVAFYHSDFPRDLGRTIQRFCGCRIQEYLSQKIHNYIVDLYNRMSATVCASTRMERVLTDCGIERVVRIPLGTDIGVFRPSLKGADVRRELGLSPKDYLLLFVGRIAREKKIKSLIGMMERLAENPGGPGKCHLLLVGDGESRRMAQKAVDQRDDVTWLKYCGSSERLCDCYSAADLFVHAGIYETFGITSLEAQACGLRVLAVKGGGLDDSISGESPLIMANTSTPEDLAESVRRIRALNDGQTPEERRLRIINHFSFQNTFERLTLLYKHILDGEPVEEFCASPDIPKEDYELHYPAVLTV